MFDAVWEDIPRTGVRSRQADDSTDTGKAETLVITTNIDSYPFLLVNVTVVDPGASFTIQILDKQTGVPKDVPRNVTSPGSTRLTWLKSWASMEGNLLRSISGLAAQASL